MLRVSTRGEYGVRLMVDLARHYGGKARSLTEISQAEGLDAKIQYLEQLIKCLREQNLVESTRGAHGGYRLSRPPSEMHMGDIVRALEGPIAPMICANETNVPIECDRLDGCSTKYLWMRVRDAITNALDSMTLADLAAVSGHSGPSVTRFVALTPRTARGEHRKSATVSTVEGL